MSDHIHLYASLPSTISLAGVVNAVKAYSSRWIHEEFSNRKGFAWQQGYGAFSVSKSAEPSITGYIRNQKKHHRRCDFKNEYISCWKNTASNMTSVTSGFDAGASRLV